MTELREALDATATAVGYTPPPVDLEPLRAGTVWRYKNYPYVVTGLSFEDKVRVLLDERGRWLIEQRDPVVAFVTMEAVPWLDDVTRDAPTFDHWIDDHSVDVDGQRWAIVECDAVHITRFPPRTVPADVPTDWKFTLYREPYKDQRPESAAAAGELVTVIAQGQLSSPWVAGQGVALIGWGTPTVIPSPLVVSVQRRTRG